MGAECRRCPSDDGSGFIHTTNPFVLDAATPRHNPTWPASVPLVPTSNRRVSKADQFQVGRWRWCVDASPCDVMMAVAGVSVTRV